MFIRKTFTEEADIIKGCLKGERKAQQALYDAYAGKFLAIAIRYVKDRDLAEDIMIEGFMKIFEKLAQFEGKGSFEGWMKRIIVTKALLALRDNKSLIMEVNADSESAFDRSGYEFTDMETADLMNMIQELSVGYRTVFNLYAIEGFNHLEIGELLGISENTSKSQLSRARAILKQKIADQNLNERRING
ncbi:RNA polymerase sigma factor [Anditalea andensis]|uniref:RNA polymerase sigma-70 factor n=1 Tax=Anditalea andensis TaxID=1048983 RepID=A0A074L5P9_9BACT|nr:sigma-70 family RNA polymerase sigma factor [Anditalea andensis]KEO75138.1 RNA polymerase sigma-70 factor [Anditalea andensis]